MYAVFSPSLAVQAICRQAPPHQRGPLRLVCRHWSDALADDVASLQLPLAALAPPPRWQDELFGPAAAPGGGGGGLGAGVAGDACGGLPPARVAALRRLRARFPAARHLVLLHNTPLGPEAVQVGRSGRCGYGRGPGVRACVPARVCLKRVQGTGCDSPAPRAVPGNVALRIPLPAFGGKGESAVL